MMTQEQVAQHIESYARRLAMIMTSTTRVHNLEKEMLVSDIKKLAEMLKFSKTTGGVRDE